MNNEDRNKGKLVPKTNKEEISYKEIKPSINEPDYLNGSPYDNAFNEPDLIDEPDLIVGTPDDEIEKALSNTKLDKNTFFNISQDKGRKNIIIFESKPDAQKFIKQMGDDFKVSFEAHECGKMVVNDKHNIKIAWISEDPKNLEKDMQDILINDRSLKKFMKPFNLKAGCCLALAIGTSALTGEAEAAMAFIQLMAVIIEKAREEFKTQSFSFESRAPEAADLLLRETANEKVLTKDSSISRISKSLVDKLEEPELNLGMENDIEQGLGLTM